MGFSLFFYAVQHTYKSVIYVKGCRFLAKKCFVCLVGMEKTSTFAPAIERDAAVIEILKAKLGSSKPLKKNFFLKISSKKFGGYKNSRYLCIRFLKESHKEEFFERFRYEQASSTILT